MAYIPSACRRTGYNHEPPCRIQPTGCQSAFDEARRSLIVAFYTWMHDEKPSSAEASEEIIGTESALRQLLVLKPGGVSDCSEPSAEAIS